MTKNSIVRFVVRLAVVFGICVFLALTLSSCKGSPVAPTPPTDPPGPDGTKDKWTIQVVYYRSEVGYPPNVDKHPVGSLWVFSNWQNGEDFYFSLYYDSTVPAVAGFLSETGLSLNVSRDYPILRFERADLPVGNHSLRIGDLARVLKVNGEFVEGTQIVASRVWVRARRDTPNSGWVEQIPGRATDMLNAKQAYFELTSSGTIKPR